MRYMKFTLIALLISTQAFGLTFEDAINMEDPYDSARAVDTFLQQSGRDLNQSQYQQVLSKAKNIENRSHSGRFISVIIKHSNTEIQQSFKRELMDSSNDFQRQAINELNFTRDNQEFALNTLKDFYQTSSDARLRGLTLRGILRNSDGQEMNIIVDALNNNSINTRVIARAIREDGTPAHLPLLVNLLRDHEDNDVRVFVRSSLKELIERHSRFSQREALYSCLPNIDSMPMSNHGDNAAFALNLLLFAGLPIISGDSDKVLPRITDEYAQTLINFYSERLEE